MGEFAGNGVGATEPGQKDSRSYGVQIYLSYRIVRTLRSSGSRKLDHD